jgi:hypothetical protein
MVLPAKQDEIADPILKGFAVRMHDAVIRKDIMHLELASGFAEPARVVCSPVLVSGGLPVLWPLLAFKPAGDGSKHHHSSLNHSLFWGASTHSRV